MIPYTTPITAGMKLTCNGEIATVITPSTGNSQLVEIAGRHTYVDRSDLYLPLRVIRVNYSNGDSAVTNMAANLTDAQMLDYFAPGTSFNVGIGDRDLMATVVSAEILI